MLVVSLTTIPPRFHLLDATLRSILDQNVKIDAVEVWIPESYRRFPQHTFCKPDVPEGVTVRISNEDFGPATKILPAAQAYRGTDARILYCDDDHTMHKGWAQSFLTVSEQNPDCAITISGCDIEFFGAKARMNKLRPRAIKKNRLLDMPFQWRKLQKKRRQRELGHKLPKIQPDAFFWREGYVDIMEGFCGVLVRPDMFDQEAFKIPDKLWSVDDIWLSGMLAKKDIGIWVNRKAEIPKEQPNATDPLCASIIEGLNRQEANRACIEYFQKRFQIWEGSHKSTIERVVNVKVKS
jgi:hypothetical protein